MFVSINSVSVLFSTALLLIGHGMQLTILPLVAEGSGMPDFAIAVTASGYFLGFFYSKLGIIVL